MVKTELARTLAVGDFDSEDKGYCVGMLERKQKIAMTLLITGSRIESLTTQIKIKLIPITKSEIFLAL